MLGKQMRQGHEQSLGLEMETLKFWRCLKAANNGAAIKSRPDTISSLFSTING